MFMVQNMQQKIQGNFEVFLSGNRRGKDSDFSKFKPQYSASNFL
jgi:hypothetical protein